MGILFPKDKKDKQVKYGRLFVDKSYRNLFEEREGKDMEREESHQFLSGGKISHGEAV